MADDEKKIIIDEDWKAQAQKEKEALKEQEKAEHEKTEETAERPPLPEADLSGLVSMLATQGFYALGMIRSEADKDKEIKPDWQLAKFNIDLLGVLEEKCKGNMSTEEEQMLTSTVEQLRMLFVQLSKKD